MRLNLDRTFWRSFLNADDGAAGGSAPELKFSEADSQAIDRILEAQQPEKPGDKAEDEGEEEEPPPGDEPPPGEKPAEKAEEATEEPEKGPAKWLDEDTAWLAEQAGISREDAAEYGSRKALVKAIAAVTRVRAEKPAAPGGASPKEKPGEEDVDSLPEGLDLSWADEDTTKALKAIHKANAEKVKKLEEALGQVTEVEDRRQREAFRDQFDATVREVDPEIFGKDSFQKATKEQLDRRSKVLNKVVPDYFAAIRAGEKPDLKGLIEGYTRFFFGEEIAKRKVASTHKSVEEQSKRRLATPNRPRPVVAKATPQESPELAELWNSYLTANGHR